MQGEIILQLIREFQRDFSVGMLKITKRNSKVSNSQFQVTREVN